MDVKRLDEEFRKDKQQEDDVLHEKGKTVLETKDLRARIKGAYTFSIIARFQLVDIKLSRIPDSIVGSEPF